MTVTGTDGTGPADMVALLETFARATRFLVRGGLQTQEHLR
jgi:hypothetical protein